MNTGERIRTLRIRQGLTLDEVAAAIGTIKQTIYKYEHGVVTNIPDDKIEALAKVLNTTPAYLRCNTADSRPLEERTLLSIRFRERLAQRLAQELENADPADVACIAPGDDVLSLDQAYETAAKLGVSLDYLTGLVDDPQSQILSLPDAELRCDIELADTELIEAVHQICGMDNHKIAEDYATGALRKKWNPAKIKIVQDFLLDSQPILKKLIASSEKEEGHE